MRISKEFLGHKKTRFEERVFLLALGGIASGTKRPWIID